MKNLIIFDVCNTLVDTNSTFSYVDYLMNKWIKPWYKVFFHNRFFWYFYTLIYLVFKFDSKIFLTKKYFKWLNVEEIKNLSQEYYERYEKKIFPNMLDVISKERWKSKIILLSASINQPIDYLKNKFQLEWYSSILEEKNGLYTWRVIQSLWWNKESIFEKWKINLNKYSQIDFYTDNWNDVWLIKYLGNHHSCVFIHIIPYKNKRYWNKFFSINKINYEFMD